MAHNSPQAVGKVLVVETQILSTKLYNVQTGEENGIFGRISNRTNI